MKKTSIFLSAIISMMLLSGFALANLSISMSPNPISVAVGTTGNASVKITDADQLGHSVSIDSIICKDTDNNRATCESYLVNGANPEITVMFDNGFPGAITNSTDEAMLKITLASSAPENVNYLFRVRSSLGWQEAVVTGETDSVPIPEYPSAIIPAILSIASFGLVSRKIR